MTGTPIFGTDGVRGRPGEGLLASESVSAIAAAVGIVLGRRGEFPTDFPRAGGDTVVLGRDTRASGASIGSLLAEGLLRCGFHVRDVGVLPTPAVAYLTALWPDAILGAVISASHNPAEYNGIKLLAPSGAKVSPELEAAVSDAYWALRSWSGGSPRGPSPGTRSALGRLEERPEEGRELYLSHLLGASRRPERLRGRRVVLDTANGATCGVAPVVFERLGLRVEAIGASPDGSNINLGCGSLAPEAIEARVPAGGADFGFCFDGDGDRVIPVTARGKILDGDHILFVTGRSYARRGFLPRRTVVATVMSNIGLELSLRKEGVALLRTDVGDRNVYLAMVAHGHPVGGEQSGHIIFLDAARTGDGILVAIRTLDALEDDRLDLEAEAGPMHRFPQIMRNVRVQEKPSLDALPAVQAVVEEARRALRDTGRVLLRYSGTEPLLRVMLEGPDHGIIEDLTVRICESVRQSVR